MKFKPIDGRICECGTRINRYAREPFCARCLHKRDVARLIKAAHKEYKPR